LKKNVFEALDRISAYSLRLTGFFCNFIPDLPQVDKANKHWLLIDAMQKRVSNKAITFAIFDVYS